MRAVVAIFARPAIPGATKTRLASAVGEEAAARLAAAFFADTWARVRGLRWATPVLSCSGEPVGLEPAPEVWIQGEGDLGERLVEVLSRGLGLAPVAIALAADAPTLPAARLEDLRTALRYADAAFVPARDGGFVALGVRRCPPGAFAGVRWSTSEAHADLSANLRRSGLVVVDLRPWLDVDVPADLDELRRVPELDEVAPRTALALRAMARRGGRPR